MLDYDAKVFWRYFIHLLNPRRITQSNSFYYFIILLIVAFNVIFTDFSIRMKSIIAGFGFLAIVIIQIYRIYKSGEHRHWDRQRKGILSKSEIKELKEKQKEIKPETPEQPKDEPEKVNVDEGNTQNTEVKGGENE